MPTGIKTKDLPKVTTAIVSTAYVVMDVAGQTVIMLMSDFLSTFAINGIRYTVVEYSSGGAQTASATYNVYVFHDTGTLQLPASASLSGQPIIVKNLTTNKIVTVMAHSGEAIDIATSLDITDNDSETFIPIANGFITT